VQFLGDPVSAVLADATARSMPRSISAISGPSCGAATPPERRQWSGVAGGEQPGIDSVLIDRRSPDDIRIGVSTGGVWASTDGGISWRNINRGMYAEYMPPEQREQPIAQDVHRLARCATIPRSSGASTTTASSVRRMPVPLGTN